MDKQAIDELRACIGVQDTGALKNLIRKLRVAEVDMRQAESIVGLLYKEARLDETLGDEELIKLKVYLDEAYEKSSEQFMLDRLNTYLTTSQGWFSTSEVDRDCNIFSKKDKDNRRQIFHRLVGKQILERHPSKNGVFRLIQDNAEEINWIDADPNNIYPIDLPFGLHDFVAIYPKSIIAIAAPPNAGKTAYVLNVIKKNCATLPIHYYSSEMGAEELKVRLLAFEDMDVNDWTFEAKERASHFDDLIRAAPDDCHIIDYIEVPEGTYYMIAPEMLAIWSALRKGIAIVALQKKGDTKQFKTGWGRGGDITAEKPRLYIVMENNVLTVKKGKIWKQKGVNPNGMQFEFSLVGGAKFSYVRKT